MFRQQPSRHRHCRLLSDRAPCVWYTLKHWIYGVVRGALLQSSRKCEFCCERNGANSISPMELNHWDSYKMQTENIYQFGTYTSPCALSKWEAYFKIIEFRLKIVGQLWYPLHGSRSIDSVLPRWYLTIILRWSMRPTTYWWNLNWSRLWLPEFVHIRASGGKL